MPEPAKKEEKKDEPHYKGHRQRLRDRFIENGADALQDYELLELVLFTAIPQKDVKPLAKDLLKKFGGLPEVMNAPLDELTKIEGIKDNTAAALKAMMALAQRGMKNELMHKPVLNSWTRLMDYCTATMAHETREHFRIIFLNKKNEMIADEIQHSGTVDHTSAYPREIVKRALDLGATALILLHNHPSGDPKPSEADVDMTRLIVRAAQPFEITIHDHVIISKNGYTSFKSLGLI
jgi:DNA repair protein RadC